VHFDQSRGIPTIHWMEPHFGDGVCDGVMRSMVTAGCKQTDHRGREVEEQLLLLLLGGDVYRIPEEIGGLI
jgi:hypothetical protein